MILILFLLVSYIICIWVFFYFWRKIPKYTVFGSFNAADLPFISVLIPVKNEASNIINLLKNLSEQEYLQDKFEVIVVNDHSEDETVSLVEEFIATAAIQIQLISLKLTRSKKSAIEEGVKNAKGEIIICTDGDCSIGPKWISTYASFFAVKKPDLVFGPVTFIEKKLPFSKKLFEQMQTIEFASLVGSGAACWRAGIPNMCNGANIAYRKSIFYEVGGFAGNEQILSGDDEFLMHKVYNLHPDKVHFIKSKMATVATTAAGNFYTFFKQRIRWAGKWEDYKNISAQLTAVYIFLINLLTAIVFVYICAFNNSFPVLFILTIRWISEGVFLHSVLKFLDKKLYLIPFVTLILLYPFYVIFFAIRARFK